MQKRVCMVVGNLCSDAFSKEFSECYGTVENFAEVAEEKDADFLLGHLAEVRKMALYSMRQGGGSTYKNLYERARRLEKLVKERRDSNDDI